MQKTMRTLLSLSRQSYRLCIGSINRCDVKGNANRLPALFRAPSCPFWGPVKLSQLAYSDRFYCTGLSQSRQIVNRTMAKRRILIAFDFDHTLVDGNTDYEIINLAPKEDLPEEITNLYSDDGWIDYMGEIFKFLHKKGCSKKDILDCLSKIPLTDGMKDLLGYKRAEVDIDFIIISDSNTVFIKFILDLENLSSSILQVFTNPAHFDSSDCLTLAGYHCQDWCKLSSENLCKGHILENFLEERRAVSVEYSNVLYVGDGYNDLCPGLRLQQKDFFMPRIGFKLHSIIENMSEGGKPSKVKAKRSDIKATVVPWSTGFDIIKQVEALLTK